MSHQFNSEDNGFLLTSFVVRALFYFRQGILSTRGKIATCQYQHMLFERNKVHVFNGKRFFADTKVR